MFDGPLHGYGSGIGSDEWEGHLRKLDIGYTYNDYMQLTFSISNFCFPVDDIDVVIWHARLFQQDGGYTASCITRLHPTYANAVEGRCLYLQNVNIQTIREYSRPISCSVDALSGW